MQSNQAILNPFADNAQPEIGVAADEHTLVETQEINGPKGPEPSHHSDWKRKWRYFNF